MFLQNLRDVLPLAYQSIQGRSTKTLQKSELIAFLEAPNFADALREIDSEISLLSGTPALSIECQDQFLSAFGERYNLGCTDLTSIENKANILYNCIIDTLLHRIKHKAVLKNELNIEEDPRCSQPNAKATTATTTTTTSDLKSTSLAPPLPLHNYNTEAKDILQTLGTEQPLESLDDLINILEDNLQALDAAIESTPSPNFLFTKDRPLISTRKDNAIRMSEMVSNEYSNRAQCIITRLGVTAQSFLSSPKAKDFQSELGSILFQAVSSIHNVSKYPAATIWQLLSMTSETLESLEQPENTLSNEIKRLSIGTVPDRGGIPDGFTSKTVAEDVQKANFSLQNKFSPSKPDRVFSRAQNTTSTTTNNHINTTSSSISDTSPSLLGNSKLQAFSQPKNRAWQSDNVRQQQSSTPHRMVEKYTNVAGVSSNNDPSDLVGRYEGNGLQGSYEGTNRRPFPGFDPTNGQVTRSPSIQQSRQVVMGAWAENIPRRT